MYNKRTRFSLKLERVINSRIPKLKQTKKREMDGSLQSLTNARNILLKDPVNNANLIQQYGMEIQKLQKEIEKEKRRTFHERILRCRGGRLGQELVNLLMLSYDRLPELLIDSMDLCSDEELSSGFLDTNHAQLRLFDYVNKDTDLWNDLNRLLRLNFYSVHSSDVQKLFLLKARDLGRLDLADLELNGINHQMFDRITPEQIMINPNYPPHVQRFFKTLTAKLQIRTSTAPYNSNDHVNSTIERFFHETNIDLNKYVDVILDG